MNENSGNGGRQNLYMMLGSINNELKNINSRLGVFGDDMKMLRADFDKRIDGTNKKIDHVEERVAHVELAQRQTAKGFQAAGGALIFLVSAIVTASINLAFKLWGKI